MDIKSIITRIVEKKLEKDSDDPCWDGYVQLGTKKKGGKEVPNCVPKESVELDEAILDEDKGIEYEKVRALMPASMPVNKWVPIKNGFEAITSSRGSYNLRRKVNMAGETRYEKFSLTKAGGLKSLGFSRMEESVELDERVEVDHSRYMISHSKKARGRGMWMFTTKDMGEPSEDEMVTVSGDLSTAAKEAAKKLGTKRVYVMEEVELDEVLAKDYSGMLGVFKKDVERAEEAKKKGDTKKMEMHLSNARNRLMGMKSSDTAKLKNTDHYDRYKKMKRLEESADLVTEDAHDTLNNIIIEFQRKLMKMSGNLDPTIAEEVAKLDESLDDLRTGPLFKNRSER